MKNMEKKGEKEMKGKNALARVAMAGIRGMEAASRGLKVIMARLVPVRHALAVSAAAFLSMEAASSGGAGSSAFSNATTEIQTYQDPVKNLLYAIAAIICLVGAFNVYFKMQNGDQDVKKTIMMTMGGAIAFVALANALPLFFS